MRNDFLDEVNDESDSPNYLETETAENDFTQNGKFEIIEKICLVQKCKLMRKKKSSVKKVSTFITSLKMSVDHSLEKKTFFRESVRSVTVEFSNFTNMMSEKMT